MLRSPRTRVSGQMSPLRRRVLNVVVLACLGATAGLLWARFTLAPDELTGHLPNMYGTLGAVGAVLGARVVGIFKAIVSDYLGGS